MLWVLALATLVAQGARTVGAIGESVAISTDPVIAHPVARDTQVVIVCKYTTADLEASSLKWMHLGQEFSETQTNKVTPAAAEDPLSVSHYTIDKAALSDSGEYTCSATYTALGAAVTSPTPFNLQVIDVVMTMSSEAAAEGSKATITCNFEQYTGSGAPTIEWFKDGTTFTSDQIAATSEGDSCGDVQRNRYIISSTATTDTGKYKCKATYTIDGKSVIIEPEPAEGKAFYVRKLSTTTKLFHVGVGASIEIVCTVNGDEASTFKWYTSTGADLDNAKFTVTSGTFADNVQTSTLKITAASVVDHEASYKCKATWLKTEPKALEDTVELKVQDVTGIKDATAITRTPGTELKITCQFEAGAVKVTWHRSGEEIKEEVPTADNSELEYTIATVAGSDSGVYSCKVYYTGETNPITGRQTKSVNVRGRTDDATIYASDGTSSVTLTCVFYGDEMNPATWHKADSGDPEVDAEGKTEVSPGTYSTVTNRLTTTLKLLTVEAEDANVYTCKTTYVSDSSTSQSVLTLSLLTNGKITSDVEIVTTGDPFTLTCNHSPAPTGTTATLQWKKDGKDIEGSDSAYSVKSASISDNGGYTCTVSYGSDYDSIESEGNIVQKVRESEVGTATTHVLDGTASVTLTCIFRGDNDFMVNPTTWSRAGVEGNLESGVKYTVTPGSKDTALTYYQRIDELVIVGLVHDDEGDYTCNNDYTQTEKTQTLSVYTISSLTSTNDKVDADGPFTLTCTHSAISTGLQVVWTKDGEAIRAGITVTPEGDNKSVLTVTAASKEDNGVYGCGVTFGSYGRLNKEISQNVRLTEVTVPSHYAVSGAAMYVMTCTFYGDALSTSVWKVGETVLTDDDEYDFSTSSPTAFSRLDTLTINTVEAANSGSYKCSAQYTSGAQDASKDILLTVLGITEFVATGETKVAYGGSVEFTCGYSVFPGGTPTVSWYKNDVIFPPALSGLIIAPSDTQSLYTVTTADESNNGVYQCKVTFGDVGTSGSDEITRYVRHVTPPGNIFGVLGLNIDVTCTFYGDALGATTWSKDSGAVVTGGQYTVTPGTYESQMRTDTLTITTLTADNAGAFTCTASYTDGSVETSSLQTLVVTDALLAVTVTKDPAEDLVVDATVTFTCTYTVKAMGPDDGTFQTAWTRSGEPLDSNIVVDKSAAGTETFQVTVPAVGGWEVNGDYKCTVTYGVFGEITAETPLLVRDIPDMSNVHVLGGEAVSLTCRVYGDQPATVTWNDGVKDLTKADAEVTDSVYANQLVESVLVIASATNSNNQYTSYSCTAGYTDPVGSESGVVKLGVLNVISQPRFIVFGPATKPAKSTLTMICTFTSITLAGITAGTTQSVTVQLFKVGTEVHLDESVVTGAEETSQDFVLPSVEPAASGEYNCKVTYGDVGHGSVTSSNLLIAIRAHSEDKTTEIITGNDVTLTCKFQGDEVGSTSWHVSGSGSPALVDDSNYDISVVAWEPVGKSLETTLTIKALAAPAYTCKGVYTADGTEVQSTQTVIVLAVQITSSEGIFSSSEASEEIFSFCNAGTVFTLTCSYSSLSDGDITVEWFKDSQPIDNNVEYNIENKADTHDSLLKFTAETATTEMNGVYKCKTTFGSVGSHEAEITQYLQSGAAPAPTKYSTSGMSVILSCVFHGSLGDTTSWYKGESPYAIESDDVDFTVTAGVPTDYKQTDTLTLINADSADSAKYRCKNRDSEDIQELYVISIATNPTDTIAEVDKTTTISCVTVETTLPTVDIAWSSSSGYMENTEVQLTSAPGVTSGFKVFTSTLTVTGVATVHSVIYTCVVQPPNQDTFKLTSTPASFYLTGVSPGAITGYTGDYIESNQLEGDLSEQYTVTFSVHKGPGLALLVFSFTDMSGEKTPVQFVKGDEVDGLLPMFYTPPYAEQATGTFTLEVGYTGFPGDENEVSAQKKVNVHSYCKIPTLVNHGTWSPSTKVEFKGTATLTCDDGYLPAGAVMVCGHKGVFKTTATPTCLAQSTVVCDPIADITNGYPVYITASSAKYQCHAGYNLQGPDLTYTCDENTQKWSLITALNPSGTPPSCEEAAPADARSESFTVSFSTAPEYCRNEAEDEKAKAALLANFKSSGAALCIDTNYCHIDNFDCSWLENKLTVKFSLVQNDKLSDSSILADTAASLKASTISLDLDTTSRRRKRASSFVSDTITSITVTTCDTGYVVEDGACVQCPEGHGVSGGACVPCPIGYYSTEKSVEPCTMCSDNFKTLSIGSKAADACKDPATLCTAPPAPAHTGLFPPTGALLDSGVMVEVSCAPGYRLEEGVNSRFACAGNPIAPICYRQCDLSMYDAQEFKSLNMEYDVFESISSMVHDQILNVSCLDGYESRYKMSYDVYRCVGNKGPDHTALNIVGCTDKPVNKLLILGLCLGAVIILLVILLVWCHFRGKARVDINVGRATDNTTKL